MKFSMSGQEKGDCRGKFDCIYIYDFDGILVPSSNPVEGEKKCVSSKILFKHCNFCWVLNDGSVFM